MKQKHELISVTFPIGCGPDGMRPEYHTIQFDRPLIPALSSESPKGSFKGNTKGKTIKTKSPQKRESRVDSRAFIKNER